MYLLNKTSLYRGIRAYIDRDAIFQQKVYQILRTFIISQEELDDIERNIGHILSELEWEVLEGYLDGRSYQEMAEVTDRSVKSIDNALQRVKRKLEKYLEHRVLDSPRATQEG